MAYCAVRLCGNTAKTSSFTKDGITFHRFPRCPERKSKWIDATYRSGWFPTKNSVICSRHFTEDCFQLMRKRRRLMDTALPTLNLPCVVSDIQSEEATTETSQSMENRKIQGSVTPTRKRKLLPLPDTPSAFDSPTKKRLCRRIIELKNTVKSKNILLKKVRDSNRKLKRRIISLKSLITELEAKNLLSSENAHILRSVDVKCKEIIKRQLQKTKTGKIMKKKYSPELRAFALTLHFYSNKAYNYVRKTFNTCLPSVKTLSKWYSSIDGLPGFTKEAFEVLKIKAKQSPTPLYCCLMFDEMKISKKIEKTFGYVDFGGQLETDCNEECTDALVYLVVPLHGKWKVPIGYFFVKSTTASQKVFLLTQAINLCHEANVIIKAVTFDGCPANLSMAEKLGCRFDVNNLKTTFTLNENEISIFLDPVHMVKLIRNSFEHYKIFKDSQNNEIAWSHIELLNEIQEKEKFHAANKLRTEHLMFKKNIMKVKLATQLFSRSVSVALTFCKYNLKFPQFQSIDATAKFLLLMNDLFDILDSKVHGYDLKRALNKENANEILSKLEEFKDYLINLTVVHRNKVVPLINSPRFTGFLGLCVCIESVKFLYNDLIVSNSCPYISFHRISQDHIELFFCIVRSHGGSNNNPTPRQFFGIYRKMIVHTELQDFNTGNCVALEDISILNCSSAVQRINMTTERGEVEKEEDVEQDTVLENFEGMSQFAESIIEYIAGAVVHYLIKSIKCNTCVKALVSLDPNPSSLIHARDLASTNLVGKFTQSVRRIVQDVKDEGASSGQTKEEVIETNERLRAVRIRLDENYDTAKKALVTLMARYSESKAERNVFTRYALLKAMIKDVIRLETQYWSLVEIPRQEKAETVPAFVLRACSIMEKTQKSGEGVKTSTKLAEEAADRRERIERLSDMTTSQIETENTQMTNDLYRLLKKYTGLRNLIRELKAEYVSSKVFPMFPRYTMLKDMIKDIMHDPDYMEVCHEVDP